MRNETSTPRPATPPPRPTHPSPGTKSFPGHTNPLPPPPPPQKR